MPVVLSIIERTILLTLNRGPGPMMDLAGGIAFHALSVAIKLKIFEAIGDKSLPPSEIAHLISTDTRATGLLLDALEALGYVEGKQGSYSNTPMTLKWILETSPNSLACMISGMEGALDRWKYMDETIRNGSPSKLAWEWLDQHPGSWADYQALMIGMAHSCADEIVSRVKLPPTASKLIDLGGGHGLYSIGFCRKYPGLTATVFDWPQAKDIANDTILSEGMNERVKFVVGDLWKDDYGSGYDVALLFQIIHMYSPEKNIQLLTKVREALSPNGILVINDQVAVDAPSPLAKLFARLQSLELLNSVNGQTYPPVEIEGWLVEAGYSNPSTMLLRNTPGFGVVVATKP